MSIAKIDEELSTPGAIPLLIEQLADDDQHARALIHLLSLIDKTSDEDRHFVINTAIEQAYARTDGSASTDAMLMRMAGGG
jgi:hypothetical protein